MPDVYLSNLLLLLPEMLLALGAMVLLMVGVFSNGLKVTDTVGGLALILNIMVAIAIIFSWPNATVTAFDGAFVADSFAFFMKSLIWISSFIVLVMSVNFFKVEKMDCFEYPVLLAFATTGAMITVSAGDLIAVYMGMELQSLSICVLAAIQRKTLRSTEAGLKYFVLGALASGMMLYGASLIYGFAGTTNFVEIAQAVSHNGSFIGLIFGLVFLIVGIAFKISAVPFHMWTPDVYMGAPTPVTALFSTVPKIAAMAVFIRITMIAFPAMIVQWQQIVVFLAIASMILGSFAAIGQKNIKRMMAYSSISHMGFALVGLAAGTMSGIKGVVLYMTIYMVMTLGIFSCILAMRRENQPVENIDELSGLSKRDPMMAFFFAMLAFSLAGIPPLAGFFAKFYVFLAAVEAELYTLALIGVLTSVVGAFYYLRIVKIMYFDDAKDVFDPMLPALRIILTISAVFIMFSFIFPRSLMLAVEIAVQSLF